jgi:hypothetical protein
VGTVSATKKRKTFRDLFECLGVALTNGAGEELIGDCPFCGKVDHFHVNESTGQWDCKVCSEEGNHITFMEHYSQKIAAETSKKTFKALARRRSVLKINGLVEEITPSLPYEIFRDNGMGWNSDLGEWWLPCRSEKGTVRDIRRWKPKAEHPRFMSTDSCQVQLFGVDELMTRKDRTRTRIWIAEGEFDAMVLRWLLNMAGINDIVVGVPGANTFKHDWVPYFAGCHVVLPYDNDKAGEDGSQKVGKTLKPVARKIEYVLWPELHPDKYDVSDMVLQSTKEEVAPAETVKILEGLLSPKHKREGGKASVVAQSSIAADCNRLPNVTWKDLVTAFKCHIEVDRNFEDGLALALATAPSGSLTGEPIWMYLIAPPGGGKTLILAALKESEHVIYESTITRTSLISGFDKGPDQSLLPRLDQKCGVFKDGTAILSLHPDARRELYGTLRDAFDGETSRPFGNCHRHYISHFNLLIGVTPAIHAENQSSTGERFLKFEMREKNGSVDAKLTASLTQMHHESVIQTLLGEKVAAFLSRPIDPEKLPKISEEVGIRLKGMAKLISVLRAQVERHPGYEKELKYRSAPEIPTRVLKQLAKLGQMLCWVFGVSEFNERVMKILMRVTLHTCTGYHVDIVRAMVRAGNPGLTAKELVKETKISHDATLSNRIHDLEQLRIVYRSMRPGELDPKTKVVHWMLSEYVQGLWAVAVGLEEKDVDL